MCCVAGWQVDEVQAWKEELLSQKRSTMERKLQRAEEKRLSQLQLRIRKAHEEETKVGDSPAHGQCSDPL